VLGEKVAGHPSDPCIARPKAVEKSEELAELGPGLDGLGSGRVQRFDRLASHTALREGPHGRRLIAGGADRAGHRLRRPSRRDPGHQGPELRRRNEAQRVDRELLEVRTVNLAPIRRVQVRPLRPRQGALDDGVRNPEALGKRSVAPRLTPREEPGENVDVGILDHGPSVSRINTPYKRRVTAGELFDRVPLLGPRDKLIDRPPVIGLPLIVLPKLFPGMHRQ